MHRNQFRRTVSAGHRRRVDRDSGSLCMQADAGLLLYRVFQGPAQLLSGSSYYSRSRCTSYENRFVIINVFYNVRLGIGRIREKKQNRNKTVNDGRLGHDDWFNRRSRFTVSSELWRKDRIRGAGNVDRPRARIVTARYNNIVRSYYYC